MRHDEKKEDFREEPICSRRGTASCGLSLRRKNIVIDFGRKFDGNGFRRAKALGRGRVGYEDV